MNLLAQNFTNPVVGNTLKNLEKGSSDRFLAIFLPKFIGLIMVFGSIAFFFMFVVGAITYIMSGSDKAGVESAKAKLTNSLIGIFLLFSSFAIIGLIENFFGVNILSIDIGPLVIQ